MTDSLDQEPLLWDYTPHLDLAVTAARQAGEIALGMYCHVAVQEKSPKNLVTAADFAAQRAIVATLRAKFPTHAILAEEEGLQPQPEDDRAWRWLIDPIDGTINYAHGVAPWCVSIALEHQGQLVVGVIYVPLGETLYTVMRGGPVRENGRVVQVSAVSAMQDALIATGFPSNFAADAPRLLAYFEAASLHGQSVRRSGSTAWNLAQVASGGFDVCFVSSLHPWDAAAGALMIEMAGGMVTRLDGNPYQVDDLEILASNARLHPSAVALLNPAERDRGQNQT